MSSPQQTPPLPVQREIGVLNFRIGDMKEQIDRVILAYNGMFEKLLKENASLKAELEKEREKKKAPTT